MSRPNTRYLSAPLQCITFVIALLLGQSALAEDAVAPSAQWRAVPLPSMSPQGPVADTDASPPLSPKTEYFRAEPSPASGERHLSGPPQPNVPRYELNFQDAEVRSVIDALLGDLLKLNFTVAPQIQGRITLRTARPAPREALLGALETALSTVGAAMLREGGTVHIVPADSVPQRVKGVTRNDASRVRAAGYAIEVVPLRFISAKELQRILDAFMPKGSVIQADETYNHLVIAGGSQDRAAMLRTIDSFDTDGMQGAVFALYRLGQVSPEQLINELKQVFQPPLELLGNRVRLVPIERMQSILGIARAQADLQLAESWIRRLDTSPKSGERTLYVYNVQNGNAKDLANALQLVLTGEVLASSPAAPSTPAGQVGSGTQPATANPAAPRSSAQSRIVANEENNSLLIFGTDLEYRLIKDALGKLDVMPRQVLIEAILAEVTLNNDLRYGVQWFFDSGENSVRLSTNESGIVGSIFPGFSYVYSGLSNARVVLNALQSQTDVRVLSAPKLAVLNNQKATLQVGDEVPIRTQTSQGTVAPGSPIVSTIQMRDTGVILEVMPRVNDNGNVILDITQEVSDVASTTSSDIDSPTIQRRRIHTVVTTRDGATVALGGLIREAGSRGKSGIPILKDVPLFGNLFSTTTTDKRKTELIVMLVPRVMRNHEEINSVVDELLMGLNDSAELASRATRAIQKVEK